MRAYDPGKIGLLAEHGTEQNEGLAEVGRRAVGSAAREGIRVRESGGREDTAQMNGGREVMSYQGSKPAGTGRALGRDGSGNRRGGGGCAGGVRGGDYGGAVFGGYGGRDGTAGDIDFEREHSAGSGRGVE